MENRDIGKMIEESLEGHKPPEEDARPLHEVIRDMTPEERSRANAEAAAQKKMRSDDAPAERSRVSPSLELQSVDSKDFNNAVREIRSERARLAPEKRTSLSGHEIALLTDLIKTTIESDNRLKTMVMEEGIASTDFSSAMHPYGEGLRRVTESLLRPDGEIMKMGPELFDSGVDVTALRRIFTKSIDTSVSAYVAKASQKRKDGGSGIELAADARDASGRRPDYKPRRDEEAMRDFIPMNAPQAGKERPATSPAPKPKSLLDRLKFWEKHDDKAA